MSEPTQARITGRIQGVLGIDVPSPQTDLIDTGLLDSLGLVSLITEIEREFGFQLPLDDFDVDRFRTVERMAELVEATGGAT